MGDGIAATLSDLNVSMNFCFELLMSLPWCSALIIPVRLDKLWRRSCLVWPQCKGNHQPKGQPAHDFATRHTASQGLPYPVLPQIVRVSFPNITCCPMAIDKYFYYA